MDDGVGDSVGAGVRVWMGGEERPSVVSALRMYGWTVVGSKTAKETRDRQEETRWMVNPGHRRSKMWHRWMMADGVVVMLRIGRAFVVDWTGI